MLFLSIKIFRRKGDFFLGGGGGLGGEKANNLSKMNGLIILIRSARHVFKLA